MFFNKTKTQHSTTRPTLGTETLEPRAMFSATAMPAIETIAVDQLDVGPVNRAAEVNQVKTYCTGYFVAGGTGFIKLGDIKGELRLTQNIGGTSGPGGTSFFTGVNSLAQANQQPNISGSADPGGDDVFMPKLLNVSMYDHMQAPVENVSMYDHVKALRYRAFAIMGR